MYTIQGDLGREPGLTGMRVCMGDQLHSTCDPLIDLKARILGQSWKKFENYSWTRKSGPHEGVSLKKSSGPNRGPGRFRVHLPNVLRCEFSFFNDLTLLHRIGKNSKNRTRPILILWNLGFVFRPSICDETWGFYFIKQCFIPFEFKFRLRLIINWYLLPTVYIPIQLRESTKFPP